MHGQTGSMGCLYRDSEKQGSSARVGSSSKTVFKSTITDRIGAEHETQTKTDSKPKTANNTRPNYTATKSLHTADTRPSTAGAGPTTDGAPPAGPDASHFSELLPMLRQTLPTVYRER